MLVYIISASGPYAEKAAEERFYLDPWEAQKVARELTETNAPAVYTVYTMTLEPWEDTYPLPARTTECKTCGRQDCPDGSAKGHASHGGFRQSD